MRFVFEFPLISRLHSPFLRAVRTAYAHDRPLTIEGTDHGCFNAFPHTNCGSNIEQLKNLVAALREVVSNVIH